MSDWPISAPDTEPHCPPPVQSSDPLQDVVSPPGPGLPGAMFLTIGVVVVHIFGSIVTAVVLLIATAITTSQLDARVLLRDVAENSGSVLIAGEMLIFLAFVAVLAIGQFGIRLPQRLGLTRLSKSHFVLILCLAMPISLACGRLHVWCVAIWDHIASYIPLSTELEQFSTAEAIKNLAETTSLPALLLLLAVAPALGEELVFRGIIGRGLVARWGTKMGVLLTSILFAAVHVHPAHAVALIPLAVLMHVVYLATRTIWGPVLLHFLNNALAAVFLKASAPAVAGAVPDDASLPISVVFFAALSVAALGRLIWQTRIQYRLADGTTWSPGYDTAELPPRGTAATAHAERPRLTTALFAGVALALFWAALTASVVTQTAGM